MTDTLTCDFAEETVQPLWHMPFLQSDLQDLVGRRDKLDVLESKLFGSGKRGTVALLGLGGVGKSRLAMEVAYRARAQRPTCSVFWVQATDALAMERDYLAIGDLLQVPGVHCSQFDIKQAVCRFLSKTFAGEWLLIIDNADDATLWEGSNSTTSEWSSLVEYLPKNSTGSILVTTRNRGVATYLAGKDVVDLTEMDVDGATEILSNLLIESDILHDRHSTRALLEKLTCLPLAIVQAASYINKNQVSFKDYLNLLEQPEHNIIELLNEDFNDKARYRDVLNPVAATWLVSFKQIQERSPLGAQYLAFVSCLSEKNIPQSLLPPASTEKESVDAIGVLKGYAFLRKQGDDHVLGPIYDMHRLVRLATRNWLMQEGTLRDWTEKALKRLLKAFPRVAWENRSLCMAYLPHAQVLCNSRLAGNRPERYELLLKISQCLQRMGNTIDGCKLLESVVRWAERNCGNSQRLLYDAYYLLGDSLRQFPGRLVEAELYLARALVGMTKYLGGGHIHTILSMVCLATLYEDQDRLQEAEELLEVAQRLARSHPGLENGLQLAWSALVNVHIKNRQYNAAEALQLEVLEAKKASVGRKNPQAFNSMTKLSKIYRLQNRLGEAGALCLKTHEASQQALGPENACTLHALDELLLIYVEQCRHEEAEEIAMKCVEVRSKMFGSEDRSALASMKALASIWHNQGRTEEAIELLTICVKGLELFDGAAHVHTCSLREELNRWRASLGWSPNMASQCPTAK